MQIMKVCVCVCVCVCVADRDVVSRWKDASESWGNVVRTPVRRAAGRIRSNSGTGSTAEYPEIQRRVISLTVPFTAVDNIIICQN